MIHTKSMQPEDQAQNIALRKYQVCRDALPRAFRPLGELFTKLTGVRPGALLCLDPHLWEIRFFGVEPESKGADADKLGEELVEAIRAQTKDKRKPKDEHRVVFQLVRDLLAAETEKVGNAEAAYLNLYDGATNLLETETVQPGNAYWNPDQTRLVAVDHWKLDKDAIPLTRFQDVLDCASQHGFDLSAMGKARDVEGFTASPTNDPILLIAERYVERPRLIRGKNVRIFVAEHIQALGREPKPALDKLKDVAHIDSYFMPLRGLGQWRAAFDCKYLGGSRQEIDELAGKIGHLKEQSNPMARGAFEDLLTTALINAFAAALHDCQQPEELFGVFATLWWSKSIYFRRQGRDKSTEPVATALWCPESLELVLDRSPTDSIGADAHGIRPPRTPKKYGRRHCAWMQVHHTESASQCKIILDLHRLDESWSQKEALLERWGFDQVEYFCDLVDPDAEEDFHRWAEALGDQLVSVRRTLVEQIKRDAAEQAEQEYSGALFAFGHHLGNLFLESGLVAFALDPTLHESKEVQRFEQIKSRLMLAWGLGEAIRPLRNNGKGYPKNWFPSEPRDIDPSLLAQDLQKIVRLYLSGLGNELNTDWLAGWHLLGGHQEIETLGDLCSRRQTLPSLPPFEVGSAGSLAVTLGLAEQVRNIRASWICNREELQRGIDDGLIDNIVDFRIEVDGESGSCAVHSDSYCFHRRQPGLSIERGLLSSSISKIKDLEEKSLAIDSQLIVETAQPIPIDQRGRYVRTRSVWTYNYGRVISAEK